MLNIKCFYAQDTHCEWLIQDNTSQRFISLTFRQALRILTLIASPRLGCRLCSVPDPWHFGVDSDPDPRISASD
jgi:hypothetical protein